MPAAILAHTHSGINRPPGSSWPFPHDVAFDAVQSLDAPTREPLHDWASHRPVHATEIDVNPVAYVAQALWREFGWSR